MQQSVTSKPYFAACNMSKAVNPNITIEYKQDPSENKPPETITYLRSPESVYPPPLNAAQQQATVTSSLYIHSTFGSGIPVTMQRRQTSSSSHTSISDKGAVNSGVMSVFFAAQTWRCSLVNANVWRRLSWTHASLRELRPSVGGVARWREAT